MIGRQKREPGQTAAQARRTRQLADLRAHFAAERFERAFRARRDAGGAEARDDMSRSDWFWFNALGALAGIHVGRRTDNETIRFTHQARQAVDLELSDQVRVINEIEALLFGVRAEAYREQSIERIVEQFAEDQEVRNGRKAARPPADSIRDGSENDTDRRRRQVADRREFEQVVSQRIGTFQMTGDRAVLIELVTLARREQQSSDVARQVSGHNLAVFAGKHLARFEGASALVEAARHSDLQGDLLGRLDDDEIEDLWGNHRAERADIACALAESVGDTRLLDETIDDLMPRSEVSPKEGIALAKCLDTRFLQEGNVSDLRSAIMLIRDVTNVNPFLSITDRLNVLAPAVNLFDWTGDVHTLANAVVDLGDALEMMAPGHPDRRAAAHTLSLAASRLFVAWPTADLARRAFRLAGIASAGGAPRVRSLLRFGAAALDLADVADEDHVGLVTRAAAALDEAIALAHAPQSGLDVAGVVPELLRVRAECAVREVRLGESPRVLHAVRRAAASHRSTLERDSPIWARLSQADAVIDEALWLSSGQSSELDCAIETARQAIVDAPRYARRQRDRARLARLQAARVRSARGKARQRALDELVELMTTTVDEFRDRARYDSFESLTTWVGDYTNLAAGVARVFVEAGRPRDAVGALEELRCFHVGVAATERERVLANLDDPLAEAAFRRTCDELRLVDLRLARTFDREHSMIRGERVPDALATLKARRDELWGDLDRFAHEGGQRVLSPDERVARIQHSLTPSSAIAFLLPPTPLDPQPMAIVLRHDGVGALSLPIGDVELDELLDGCLRLGHQRFEGDANGFVAQLCDAVDRVFLAPVLGSLGEAVDQLWIVPIGRLTLLPVHAVAGNAPRVVSWLLKAEQLLGDRHEHGWHDVASVDGEFLVDELRMIGPAQRAIDEAISARSRTAPVEGDDVRSQIAPFTVIGRSTSFVALCHGHAQPDELGIYLATKAGPLPFDDLRGVPQRQRSTAFLASCCTRTPLQTMPDEVLGFADALVNAGFSTVIAASWPVRWEVAAIAVLQFTRHAHDNPQMTAAAVLTDVTRWMRTAGIDDIADLVAVLQARRPDGGPALGQLGAILQRSGHLDFTHPIDWAAFSACG